MFKRGISFLISLSLLFQQTGFAQVMPQFPIPPYLNNLAPIQDRFRPVHLRSISFEPAENKFDLLLDKGDSKDLEQSQLDEITSRLMDYFRIGLSLPNSMFWVNLRPDSPDNIIDPYLEKTDVGKILLEADLQLKKDLAALTSPDTVEGRQYWNKLYEKANQIFGQEDMAIPTFTRPWIVPGEVIIGEGENSAYVYKATLKVCLEQDYLKDSPLFKFDDPRIKQINEYSSELIRQLILPRLTTVVNGSGRYAALRQVYYSLILAQWFKSRNKNKADIDNKDLSGLTSKTLWTKDAYYQAYRKSFQQGEYKKEETVETGSGCVIRSYFSGGMMFQGGDFEFITQRPDFGLKDGGNGNNTVKAKVPADIDEEESTGAVKDVVSKLIEDLYFPGEFSSQNQYLPQSRVDAIKEAAEIFNYLKEAGVPEKLFSLFQEPYMILRYKSFAEFYKNLSSKDKNKSALKLRQKFIDHLGKVTVFRASLFENISDHESYISNGLNSRFRANVPGVSKEEARLFLRYGIHYVVGKTIEEAKFTDEESGRDGRQNKFFLPVSVLDDRIEDVEKARQRARAVARQIAASYARATVIDKKGIRNPDNSGILYYYGGEEIIVYECEIDRFYLIEQAGTRILADINSHKHSERANMLLQLDDGALETIDQLSDPNFEGLVTHIPPESIKSAVTYSLADGIGYVILDGDRTERDSRYRYIYGYDYSKNMPLEEMKNLEHEIIYERSGTTGENISAASSAGSFAPFKNLSLASPDNPEERAREFAEYARTHSVYWLQKPISKDAPEEQDRRWYGAIERKDELLRKWIAAYYDISEQETEKIAACLEFDEFMISAGFMLISLYYAPVIKKPGPRTADGQAQKDGGIILENLTPLNLLRVAEDLKDYINSRGIETREELDAIIKKFMTISGISEEDISRIENEYIVISQKETVLDSYREKKAAFFSIDIKITHEDIWLTGTVDKREPEYEALVRWSAELEEYLKDIRIQMGNDKQAEQVWKSAVKEVMKEAPKDVQRIIGQYFTPKIMDHYGGHHLWTVVFVLKKNISLSDIFIDKKDMAEEKLWEHNDVFASLVRQYNASNESNEKPAQIALRIIRLLQRNGINEKFWDLFKDYRVSLRYLEFIRFYNTLDAPDNYNSEELLELFKKSLGALRVFRSVALTREQAGSLWDHNMPSKDLRSGLLEAKPSADIVKLADKYGIGPLARSVVMEDKNVDYKSLPEEFIGSDGITVNRPFLPVTELKGASLAIVRSHLIAYIEIYGDLLKMIGELRNNNGGKIKNLINVFKSRGPGWREILLRDTLASSKSFYLSRLQEQKLSSAEIDSFEEYVRKKLSDCKSTSIYMFDIEIPRFSLVEFTRNPLIREIEWSYPVPKFKLFLYNDPDTGERVETAKWDERIEILAPEIKMNEIKAVWRYNIYGPQCAYIDYSGMPDERVPSIVEGRKIYESVKDGGEEFERLIKGAEAVPGMQDKEAGGKRFDVYVLDSKYAGPVFYYNHLPMLAIKARQGTGEKYSVYITAELLSRIRENDRMLQALALFLFSGNDAETGDESRIGAWAQTKEAYPDEMKALIKMQIDGMEPEDIVSLIIEYEDDYNGRGKGMIKEKKLWDEFEKEIYDYCAKKVSGSIPGKLQDLVRIFGLQRMIAIMLNPDIIEALALGWGEKSTVVRARLASASAMLQQMEAHKAAVDGIRDAFKKLNSPELRASLSRKTHEGWLLVMKMNPRYVAYTMDLHAALADWIGGKIVKSVTLAMINDPNFKFKISKSDFDFENLDPGQKKAFFEMFKKVTGLEFESFGEKEMIINSVCGEWDKLLEIFPEGKLREARLEFLMKLQQDNIGAIIVALKDSRLMGRLLSGDEAEKKQAVVDILRMINAAWRLNNPWGGFSDRLLNKSFSVDEDGIGLEDISKDMVVLKMVLDELNRQIRMGNSVNLLGLDLNIITNAYDLGLGRVLEDMSENKVLETEVRKNQFNMPKQKRLSEVISEAADILKAQFFDSFEKAKAALDAVLQDILIRIGVSGQAVRIYVETASSQFSITPEQGGLYFVKPQSPEGFLAQTLAVIPEKFEDLTLLFSDKQAIAAGLTDDIIKAMAKAWDIDAWEVRSRLKNALEIYDQMRHIKQITDAITEEFKDLNPGLVKYLTDRSHMPWLENMKKNGHFVAYTKELHNALEGWIKAGIIKKATWEQLCDPREKYKFFYNDFQLNHLSEADRERFLKEFKNLTHHAFSEFKPDSPDKPDTLVINTLSATPEDSISLIDTPEYKNARADFLAGQQLDNIGSIETVLSDPALVARLLSSDSLERKIAVIDVLRTINAGWRLNNAKAGFSDTLIYKPFSLDGIGLEDISKDLEAFKNIMDGLHDALNAGIKVDMGDIDTGIILELYDNGLADTLEQMSDKNVLESAVKYNQSLMPGHRGMSFNSMIGISVDSMSASPAKAAAYDGGTTRNDKKVAGIDFRTLPKPVSRQGTRAVMPRISGSKVADLSGEWSSIRRAICTKAVPYQRIKEYWAVCCQQQGGEQYKQEIVACLMNIMRIEEDYALPTNPGLKDLLISLE